MERMQALIQIIQASSKELLVQEIKAAAEFKLYYYQSVCDQNKIEKELIRPLFALPEPELYVRSLCKRYRPASVDELHSYLVKGNVLVFSPSDYYFFEANQILNNKPGDAEIETTIQGPQSSLTEDIGSNLNLIRHRYKSQDFTIEPYELGRVSKTPAYLLYDAALVDSAVLSELQRRLSLIDASMVLSTGQLENMLNTTRRSLFPTMMLTNRADRIALNLSQGKIVIVIQGTPFALILPAVFFDFMSSMDDLYLPYWVSKGLQFLRYVSLFLTITLPALYIAVISFNPGFFRVQLTLSIAGSRADVPYPSYIEVIFMLFMTEALTEASIRLPKFIGGTATTVGGLILGQAAEQAGLVSSIMIIVTSAVTISNFVIPISTMSFAVRVVRYPLILLSTLYGLVGLIVGLFWVAGFLVDQRSFGKPYFKIFSGEPSKTFNTPVPKGEKHR
ncbi:spore germination protein [Paenibacillus ehimensis]|uniref:Spore germination protein n=1 Tax=Paenibacillus ehimensis TaxID=79264 RepID=A0ABT8VIT6_9BACL|nr:spore germination protein [Paenibacillus ehimensis]MDO3680870.1 spore germination protein [Paenibacillus ehimensis]MEC0211949.1 spore germination protein [Paenibacillus ehimensis]